MVTRARICFLKPNVFLSDLTVVEPSNIQEALLHDKWHTAANDEYNAFVRIRLGLLFLYLLTDVQLVVNGYLNLKGTLMAPFLDTRPG